MLVDDSLFLVFSDSLMFFATFLISLKPHRKPCDERFFSDMP